MTAVPRRIKPVSLSNESGEVLARTQASGPSEVVASGASSQAGLPHGPDEGSFGITPDSRLSPIDHAPGDVFAGRYQLVQPLGRGGMGTIWRARSLALEIDVALKLVHRATTTPKTQERLLREARAAASLGHPSIVRVFDFGMTEAGDPFLVMELLEGRTLADWLNERGRLPATTAVQLLLPIASALAAAHGRGVIHRDIKPENIMIVAGEGETQIPKLVDFGIVKVSVHDESSMTLTQQGTMVGSPAYMSPEQARGKSDLDLHTDIWSFCVVLYELISGRRPFQGNNHGSLIFSIYADAPKPTTEDAAGDATLWEVLKRGLEKDPANRWPDMRTLGRELAWWAVANGVTTDCTGTSIVQTWLHRPGSFPDLPPEEIPDRISFGADTRAAAVLATPAPVAASPETGIVRAVPPPWIRSRRSLVFVGLSVVAIAVFALFFVVTAFHSPKPAPKALRESQTGPAPTVVIRMPVVTPDAAVVPTAAAPSTSALVEPDRRTQPPIPRGFPQRPPAAASSAKKGKPAVPLPSTPDF